MINDGSSVENQSIRGGAPRKAGDTADSDGSSPANNFDAVHVTGALALVVVLIFGLRFLARKMFALPTVRTSPLVKVLARSPVSPKQQVLLLHVGRRILVVADSGSAMQPLAQITDADEIAALLGQLSNNSGLARSQSARCSIACGGISSPRRCPRAWRPAASAMKCRRILKPKPYRQARLLRRPRNCKD